ncbi:glucose-1-phosphate cytidylyltransferase [Terriglobus albidus]|uniref:glucose-1-phosphate cytidylyltransferase n=1 Tax=Terriglobus albidus TaxID=1592106 RepID=UPI0021E04A74|nr:glucose-1-phosphate cytidylyltransferase [Terriglobus albidus]
MKAVILAGGLGTRISEETGIRPKPMVEIGGKPILWHILKIYSQHQINDFIICCGYKGYLIKEYFANYFMHTSDVTFHMQENRMEVHQSVAEPWKVTLVNTGENTGTGGRLRRVAEYLKGEKEFCLTYGDGVADIDITSTVDFHRKHGKLATVTAILPPARFGSLNVEGTSVSEFQEKPQGQGGWINGGFFVLSPKVIDEIHDDYWMFEQEPVRRLTEKQQVEAYFHHGFWQAMDTLRDKHRLEDLWATGAAPWKVW